MQRERGLNVVGGGVARLVPCRVSARDRLKNQACPTHKVWQCRARKGDNKGDNLAQEPA